MKIIFNTHHMTFRAGKRVGLRGLRPGRNAVTDAQLEGLCADPYFVELCERGDVVVLEPTSPMPPVATITHRWLGPPPGITPAQFPAFKREARIPQVFRDRDGNFRTLTLFEGAELPADLYEDWRLDMHRAVKLHPRAEQGAAKGTTT